jgi:hypothetical protein
VKGIADDGALIAEFSDQPGRTQTLTSAEISIRMTENKKQSSTRAAPQEAA